MHADKARFISLLDRAAETGQPIRFWWRDDDAATATPHLETLLSLQARHAIPLALAVIPARAKSDLANALTPNPGVSIFQHGYEHKNHADKARGERACEFPHSRPLEESLCVLRDGFERLTGLFGDRFLPVLTPPWNRISKKMRDARHDIGLTGLSAYGRLPVQDRYQVNAHVDILRWRGGARFAGRQKCYRSLVAQSRMRLAGADRPIGLLTHHLDHDDAANAFMDEVLSITAHHPGAVWPALTEVFGIKSG